VRPNSGNSVNSLYSQYIYAFSVTVLRDSVSDLMLNTMAIADDAYSESDSQGPITPLSVSWRFYLMRCRYDELAAVYTLNTALFDDQL
jgi:hypothetical protein